MAKTATIFHPAPTKEVKMALIPIDSTERYANVSIQKAQIGAIVTFQDTWKRTKFRLVRRTKIPVKSNVFTFLMRAIYGETMTYERFMESWRATATSEGWISGEKSSLDCFSDEVLLLELESLK